MGKKRKTKRKSRKKISFWQKYKKLIYILIVIFLSTFFIYSNFYTAKLLLKEKKSKKKEYPNKKLLEKMNKMLKEERRKVDILKKELNKIKKSKKSEKKAIKQKVKKIISSEAMDYNKSLESYKAIKSHKKSQNPIILKSKKPLLAIIIDDVAYKSEVKKIKTLHFKVTPSLFPPTKRHPDTPKLAKEFNFYMVHLPLQAVRYPHPEPKTLLITSSQKDIDTRIDNIKKWFPRDKFINNHTGSLFTCDKQAMIKLYKALSRNRLIFIDSRTSANTVVPKVAKIFHQKLLSRDIFIDNIADISYIRGQLKKAVKKAKKNGYAIAIGHPHPKTFEALRKSKSLFKDVKLVYVSTIYENIKSNSK